MTIVRRPDGTPYNGGDFDGEGLVLERGDRTILATSEREPSIRRFRLSDGKEIASLPLPSRFQVEALALGGYLPGGRRQLYLMFDDNNGATQITRLSSLAVSL
jgi:hypothetical protein